MTAKETRMHEMKRVFNITKNVYNLSWNKKLRHNQKVARPDALYAAETFKITRNGEEEKLEEVQRRILKKILGAKRNNNTEYMLRPTENYT